MKCYYHPDREIVATCTECGKGLCRECASKWDPILCDDCTRERIAEKRANLRNSIAFGVVIFVIGVIGGIIGAIQEGNPENLLMGVVLGYAIAGVPNGWSILSRIQPNMFLFLPLVGWLIYFFVKFLISIVVGLFAFPINIYRFWKGNKEADELEKNIKK